MVRNTNYKINGRSTIWQRLTRRHLELLAEILAICTPKERAEILAVVANVRQIRGPQ